MSKFIVLRGTVINAAEIQTVQLCCNKDTEGQRLEVHFICRCFLGGGDISWDYPDLDSAEADYKSLVNQLMP